MKKLIKKACIFSLSLMILMVSMPVHASISTDSNTISDDFADYSCMEFAFKSREDVVSPVATFDISLSEDQLVAEYEKLEDFLYQENSENIQQIRNYVESSNLDEYGYIGLEEYILSQLDEFEANDIYISDYKIYIPNPENLRASEVNYGSYDGFNFKAVYTVSNESYGTKFTNWSDISSWTNLAKDIALNFVTARFTVPYTIFSSIIPKTEVKTGAWVDAYAADEVTNRIIYIQDKNQKVSQNANAYVPVIMDTARINQIQTTLYPNSPYFGQQTKNSARKETASANFYNSSYNLKTGYTTYITGNGYAVSDFRVSKGTFKIQ